MRSIYTSIENTEVIILRYDVVFLLCLGATHEQKLVEILLSYQLKVCQYLNIFASAYFYLQSKHKVLYTNANKGDKVAGVCYSRMHKSYLH